MTSLESAWLVIKKAFERAKEKFVKTQVIKWANAYLAIRSKIPLNIYYIAHYKKTKTRGSGSFFRWKCCEQNTFWGQQSLFDLNIKRKEWWRHTSVKFIRYLGIHFKSWGIKAGNSKTSLLTLCLIFEVFCKIKTLSLTVCGDRDYSLLVHHHTHTYTVEK